MPSKSKVDIFKFNKIFGLTLDKFKLSKPLILRGVLFKEKVDLSNDTSISFLKSPSTFADKE
jgi:hypothetical protein